MRSIAIQQDHKVLAGGRFTTFNAETQYGQLIRLQGSLLTGIDEGHDASAALNACWNSGELRVTVPSDFTGDARLNVYTSTGQLVYSQRTDATANSTFSVQMNQFEAPRSLRALR